MSQGDGKYSWRKIADDTWQTGPQRSANYVGTITYSELNDNYTLLIEPSSTEDTYDTLAQAKNAFRKFLFDK